MQNQSACSSQIQAINHLTVMATHRQQMNCVYDSKSNSDILVPTKFSASF